MWLTLTLVDALSHVAHRHASRQGEVVCWQGSGGWLLPGRHHHATRQGRHQGCQRLQRRSTRRNRKLYTCTTRSAASRCRCAMVGRPTCTACRAVRGLSQGYQGCWQACLQCCRHHILCLPQRRTPQARCDAGVRARQCLRRRHRCCCSCAPLPGCYARGGPGAGCGATAATTTTGCRAVLAAQHTRVQRKAVVKANVRVAAGHLRAGVGCEVVCVCVRGGGSGKGADTQ
jgi:hypothetical protein